MPTEPPDRIPPWVDWDFNDTPLRFPQGPSIDLHQESGIRFFVRENSANTKLMIQVHHACADGIGMIIFLKDFLESYIAIHTNTLNQIGGKTKPELLFNRDLFLIKKRRSFSASAFLEKCRQAISLFTFA